MPGTATDEEVDMKLDPRTRSAGSFAPTGESVHPAPSYVAWSNLGTGASHRPAMDRATAITPSAHRRPPETPT